MRALWKWFGGERERVPHSAQFGPTSVHFTLTAHVDHDVNIARAARRLLDNDLAVSAAWPSEQQIRVAKRFRPMARRLVAYRALLRDYEAADRDRTWRSGIGFAVRHPRVGVLHLRSLWAVRVAADLDRLLASETLRALVVFIIKHPVVGIRHVLPIVTIGRTPATDRGGDVARDAAVFRPAPHVADGDIESGDSDAASALDALNEAERIVVEQQVISAVERYVDATLFAGRDRDEDRFVRLQLRNSYHEFVAPGSGSGSTEQLVLEPRLLIHDTGVVQLDLRLDTEGPLTGKGLIELMAGPAPRIARSEMTSPLIDGSGWEALEWAQTGEVDAGRPLVSIEHDEPVSVLDVLFSHLNAVLAVIGHRYDAWLHYPTAFVEPGPCCDRSLWRQRHAEDVQRVVYRMQGPSRAAAHVPFPPDLSMHHEHSLYAELGSAVYVQWEGDRPEAVDELYTTLIIEYALLTYMRLQSMEASVSQMSLKDGELRRRYAEAVRLFAELRQGNLRSGEARDIAQHVLTKLGADRIRPNIEAGLSLAGSAHSTMSEQSASRRSWWLAFFAAVLAALVSVPALADLLEAVKEQPDAGDLEPVLAPLRWLESLGFFGPWVLILALVGASLAVAGLTWLRRVWPRNRPALRRGFAWPTAVSVVSSSSDETDPPGDDGGGGPHGSHRA